MSIIEWFDQVDEKQIQRQVNENIVSTKFELENYTSPFQIANEHRRMLCQDIAFAIEGTLGKCNPINQLYESVTPIMIQVYTVWDPALP